MIRFFGVFFNAVQCQYVPTQKIFEFIPLFSEVLPQNHAMHTVA